MGCRMRPCRPCSSQSSSTRSGRRSSGCARPTLDSSATRCSKQRSSGASSKPRSASVLLMPGLPSVVEMARDLIRLDTTNPPGDEHTAVDLIERVLKDAHIECARYENAPGRPNLVALVKGRGEAPPLLLQGHVDVVTTVNQQWSRKPFGGDIVDGYLWGRGALDMKSGVAMMVGAALRAQARGGAPGDLMLAALADEEAGGIVGAQWLGRCPPRAVTGRPHPNRGFEASLHNTVNATIVSGGLKINVIPSEVRVQLDGRLLPGFGPEDMVRELRAVVGPEPEIEVTLAGPAQPEVDLSQFDLFASVLQEADPGCVPVPSLVTGGTDARHFARLGIRTYGFLPLNIPADFNSSHTIHAADERVPVSALEFGAECVYEAVMRYRG